MRIGFQLTGYYLGARQLSNDFRNEDEVTYTTINRELALMRAMFNVLIKAGKATKNPVSMVTFFEEIEKEQIFILH